MSADLTPEEARDLAKQSVADMQEGLVLADCGAWFDLVKSKLRDPSHWVDVWVVREAWGWSAHQQVLPVQDGVDLYLPGVRNPNIVICASPANLKSFMVLADRGGDLVTILDDGFESDYPSEIEEDLLSLLAFTYRKQMEHINALIEESNIIYNAILPEGRRN